MNRRTIRQSSAVRLVSLVATAGAVTLAAVGCSSDPETDATSPVTTTTISGQHGEDGGGDVDFEVAIGECVKLTGAMMSAKIDHAACGTADSNYKVVSKAPTQDQCPGDVDQVYYVTRGLGGDETGALCLDTDWIVGECMKVPMLGSAERVPCTDTTFGVVRADAILENTSDENQCPETTTKYYDHDERNFVVCVSEPAALSR